MLLTAAILAAVVFIVFCGMLGWIKSSRGLQWVQSRINAAIPGKITLGEHHLSLLRPRLELVDGMLYAPGGQALAGFSRFVVELDGWSLWRRQLRLDRVVLQAPWADLRVHETGGLNLMTALSLPDDDQEPTIGEFDLPLNIVLTSLRLSDGRLSFTSADAGTQLAITGVHLSAHGDLAGRRAGVDLQLADVRFSNAEMRPQPARLDLKADLNGDRMNLTALEVASGQTHLKLTGSADDLFTSPKLDSTLVIDSQAAELKTLFNLSGDYSSPLHAELILRGAVANPDARLKIAAGDGRIASRPLDHAQLSIHLHDREATLDSTFWRLADGKVALNGTVDLRKAFPSGFLTAPVDIDAIAYALTLKPEIPNLEPWLKSMIPTVGQMTGRVAINGKGVTAPALSARLEWVASGQDLRAPGMDRTIHADLNLSASMERGELTLSRLNATADGVKLFANGHLQLQDRTLAGVLSLTADDLSRSLAVVGLDSIKGACNAVLTVAGNLNRPQISVNLDADNLHLDAYTVGNLEIDAALDAEGRIDVNSLHVKNRGSRLQGNGRLRLLPDGGGIDPRFDNALDLTLKQFSPADFMKSPPVTGTLDGQLRIGGALSSLEGSLFLDGRTLDSAAADLGDLNAGMHLNDGTVHIDRLNLRNQSSVIRAKGSVRLLDPGTMRLSAEPSFEISVDSDHLDPSDFIDDPLKGDFTFDSQFTGTLAEPAGNITLRGRKIDLAGQPIDTLTLDARLKDKRLWLDRLLAGVAPGERIDGSGWIGLDRTANLQMNSDGIRLSHIQPLQDDFPGEGTLRFKATGKGHLDNPDIEGHLTVSDITLADQPIEDMDLTFRLHDMRARVSGNLNVAVQATFDLKQGDFDARLLFDETEIASFFKIAGQPDLHGTLDGYANATGNIRDPTHLTAQVELDEVDVRLKNTPLIQSDRISLKMADRRLNVSAFALTLLSAGNLRLEGNANLDGRLDLAIDGRIPLTAAATFSEALNDAVGMLAISGSVTGKASDPRLNARIDLDGIGMIVPGLVQELHDLNGHIIVTTDSVHIETLSGLLDTGRFSVRGGMNHEGFKPRQLNLALAAQSLPLEIPDTLTLLVNGNIEITGDHRFADARGEIVLLEGVYYKDVKINLLKLATTRQRTVAPTAEPVTLPWFDTVNLDLAINNRQPFQVDNNLAELEIGPDLKIGGTLARPVVSGRAEVKNGTVTFQKKTFEVNKGVIDFVNPYKTEAEIDIESQTQIRSWTITLTIKGTPDNLDLRLSSVPSETDSDILSLILFGRTARELTAGNGGAKRSTSQILAEMIADTFSEDIKKSTGVDILQVETNNGDGEETDDTNNVKVTVGKHLSDRMTVKFAVETKDGQIVQRAITEYKLLENILVSGFQDTNGIYGSEFVFRIEFR